MSDIIIPNAKPPTNCFTCDYEKLTENCPCHIGISSASEYKNSRHPDCPLKEIPTHGNWHTGTPTEEGWYLIKYECIYEGRYKGNIAYSTFKIQIYDNGYIDFAGGIGSDEVWQPVEYLRIGDVWKPKETD